VVRGSHYHADGSGNNILEFQASQALHRAQRVKKSLDRETIITASVDKHPEVTEALGDPQKYKMARKHVRHAATRATLENETTGQRLDRGVPELQRRLEELRKPLKIYEMIAAHMSAARDNNADEPSLNDSPDANDYRDLFESHGFGIENSIGLLATEPEVSHNVAVKWGTRQRSERGSNLLGRHDTILYGTLAGDGATVNWLRSPGRAAPPLPTLPLEWSGLTWSSLVPHRQE